MYFREMPLDEGLGEIWKIGSNDVFSNVWSIYLIVY